MSRCRFACRSGDNVRVQRQTAKHQLDGAERTAVPGTERRSTIDDGARWKTATETASLAAQALGRQLRILNDFCMRRCAFSGVTTARGARVDENMLPENKWRNRLKFKVPQK